MGNVIDLGGVRAARDAIGEAVAGLQACLQDFITAAGDGERRDILDEMAAHLAVLATG